MCFFNHSSFLQLPETDTVYITALILSYKVFQSMGKRDILYSLPYLSLLRIFYDLESEMNK